MTRVPQTLSHSESTAARISAYWVETGCLVSLHGPVPRRAAYRHRAGDNQFDSVEVWLGGPDVAAFVTGVKGKGCDPVAYPTRAAGSGGGSVPNQILPPIGEGHYPSRPSVSCSTSMDDLASIAARTSSTSSTRMARVPCRPLVT